jgi:hypothetical protein
MVVSEELEKEAGGSGLRYTSAIRKQSTAMNVSAQTTLSKLPEITIRFWIDKIVATTLGETGGDAVSMSLRLGYSVASLILIGIFIVAVAAQISAKSFHPFLLSTAYSRQRFLRRSSFPASCFSRKRRAIIRATYRRRPENFSGRLPPSRPGCWCPA